MLVNPFDIISDVEEAYRFKKGTLCKSVRRGITAEARAVAMYVCRKTTSYSYVEIGEHFNKESSTVIHSCRRVKKWRDASCKPHAESVIKTLFSKYDVMR